MTLKITVILVLVTCLKAILAYDVYVDPVKGECQPSCLFKLEKTPCCSLEYVASEFGSSISNLTIHLPQKIVVSQLLLFQNVSFLSIVRFSKQKAILTCQHSSSNGLRFVNVMFLKVFNVLIENCGGKHFTVNDTAIKVSIAVVNCSNIEFLYIETHKSNASAMLIENTSGNISLINISILKHGSFPVRVEPGTSYAKGIFIYSNTSLTQTKYTIKNSRFIEIKTWIYESLDIHNVKNVNDWLGYGLGGGLSFVFDGDSSNNTVSVINCTFKGNFAPWGAGMYIGFQNSSSFNSVFVAHSMFEDCSAGVSGGGLGICLFKRVYKANTVDVYNTTFSNNSAEYGAGTGICALHSTTLENKEYTFATFSNCSWTKNSGRYSPAVDIAPTRFDEQQNGVLPFIDFENCNFLKNQITYHRNNNTSYASSGVFVITQFTVTFYGILYFESNFFTALLLNSGKVVLQNVLIHFTNNTGSRGGAISLNGFSMISIHDNCKAFFSNNHATEYGGAIFYYPIEQREIFEGRVCFLEYSGSLSTPIEKRNISFIFSKNTACIRGSAIYSTSLFSCYYSYLGHYEGHKIYKFFEKIGNFIFDNSTEIGPYLGTAEYYFVQQVPVKQSLSLKTAPGQQLTIPITVLDELKQDVKSEFFVRIMKIKNTNIHVNSPYTINRTIFIYGSPNERATIVISSQNTYRGIQYEMNVTLLPCPPGYYLDSIKFACICSYLNQSKSYLGITKCNEKNFTAIIQKGYWAGHHNNGSKLYTAQCPFQFCVHSTQPGAEYSLPYLSQNLSSFMCGSTRHGMLCGKCEDGYSTFYHSRKFLCGSSDLCSYGIVLFIVSDILPVLIFFLVVIIFDVSFSSGARNGFIFFSQMIAILHSEYNTFTNDQFHEYFTVGYRWIYGIFNIDFFSAEPLSFCLFSNATVLDVLAFKYITSVLALALVLVSTIGINYCNCDKLCILLRKKITTKESVLNGLSAFLVISYAECIRVSFFILRWKVLTGEGGEYGPYVAFYGGVNYFKGRHLLYAIPAILTLGTIGLLLPMLLIIYPSTLKVLYLCKLSEHRFVLGVLRVTRVNTFMPMFDVFQGCFKDNFRFFAGLYFFYRVILLMPYSFSQNPLECAVYSELILVFIFGLHLTVHPYKENKYNIIDGLLFCNLAIINGISIISMLKVSESQNLLFEKSVAYKIVLYVQLLFVYLPIFIITLYSVKKLLKFCPIKARNVPNNEINDESNLLDYLENR